MLPAMRDGVGDGDRLGRGGGTCSASRGTFPTRYPSISLRDLCGPQGILHGGLWAASRPDGRQSPSPQPSAVPCPRLGEDPAALWLLPPEHGGGRGTSPSFLSQLFKSFPVTISSCLMGVVKELGWL